MRTFLLVLLLSSTAQAGIVHRPCNPGWRYIHPSVCCVQEIELCAENAVETILEPTSRGVGNVADQSQTGFDGGLVLGSLIAGSSFVGDGLFGPGGGGGGGIGGGWNGSGDGSTGNGGSGWTPDNEDRDGPSGPSRDVPEPSGIVIWVIGFVGPFIWMGQWTKMTVPCSSFCLVNLSCTRRRWVDSIGGDSRWVGHGVTL